MLRDEVWDEAVRAVRGDAHGLVSVRDDVLGRWSEAHRGYHDLRHLDEVVDALAELRDGAIDGAIEWASVVFAAWFHDAIYDITTAAENERRSAELARTALSANGIGIDVVGAVVALIEASEVHDVHETRGPQAVFHDADLWILAAPVERFDDYCADVRREYAAVPDEAYAQARAAILAPFFDREAVYRTAHARREWESAARSNLRRELSRLG
ncbi:hypothetical protein V6K52_16485 [Knoellia sp. S7-12]|uniref:HD domain-containing protein n=1 Tax=Knoellia sp. S7-12 TaxID=3126698 RepID=UPI0033688870